MKKKIVVFGSGNFGTTIAKVVSENVIKKKTVDDEVVIWSYDQTVADNINNDLINEKYLPIIKLPTNLKASTDLIACAKSADILLIIIPHEFITKTLLTVNEYLKKDCLIVNFSKGYFFEKGRLILLHQHIYDLTKKTVCSIAGPNIAVELANRNYTIANYGIKTENDKAKIQNLLYLIFNNSYFRLDYLENIEVVEVFSGLKNIIAIGYGIILEYTKSYNTTAFYLKRGLDEMLKFSKLICPSIEDKDIWNSCGFGDVFVTCFAGRNSKAGRLIAAGKYKAKSVEKHFGGQKIQGLTTTLDIYHFLGDKINEFPIFRAIYRILFEQYNIKEITKVFK